ncbi:MAG: ferredoxin-NADP reductase [Bermanella sp.]|jgi:ferredoxin-NADP reductase
MFRLASIKPIIRPFISPEQYDFWAQELGSISAWQRCFARVVSRTDESADCFTLRLRPNHNMPVYQSGQHINLSSVIEGRRINRSYSLTSLPGEGDLSITLRREPQGLMSNWLYDNAHAGATLEIGTVFGDMTLSRCGVRNNDSLILLAAGSGITPLYALIRDAIAKGHEGEITLLYWDKSSQHFCFDAELDALETSSQLIVHRVTTQTDSDSQHQGRISEAQILALCPELANAEVDSASLHTFVCGGAGFVGNARQISTALGRQQIHAEAFSAPTTQSDREAAETTYRVELLRSGTSLEVSGNSNLLTALESAGIAVESGCRMGICNTCSCPTREGSTLDTSTGLMNSGNATRLCISQARSNLILDL